MRACARGSRLSGPRSDGFRPVERRSRDTWRMARSMAPESHIPHLERLGQDHEVYKDVQSALDRIAGVELMTARDAQGAYVEMAPRGLPGEACRSRRLARGLFRSCPWSRSLPWRVAVS